MSNNHLILGAATNYEYENLRLFLETLDRTDFDGDLCLLVAEDLSTSEREKIIQHRYNVILLDVADPKSIYNTRYQRYYQFLVKSRHYQKIFLTDVRDVIFQSNPFNYPFENSLLCFLECKDVTLGAEPINSSWIHYVFGEEELKKISDRPISCSGTTLGTYREILIYLMAMISCFATINPEALNCAYIDQGAHNYLLWNDLIPTEVRVLENWEGPICTMALEKEFKMDLNKRLLNKDSSIIPVLHQYDRHPDLELGVLQKHAEQIQQQRSSFQLVPEIILL